MKDLIARKLVLNMFMTLMLALSVQGEELIPEIIISQTIEPSRLESSGEDDAIPVAARFDITISEIMYATSDDKAPQWIELHNRSKRRVSLEGWEMAIMNHPEDKSVIATNLIFPLGAKILDANQVLLLVAEQGHNSGIREAKGDLQRDCVVILKDHIGGTPGYRLLSQTAFKVTLRAPTKTKTARKMLSDIVGNLGAVPEWELSLIKDKRSSIIRVYEGNNATGDPYDGTAAYGWRLAAENSSLYAQRTTYYGHHSDHSTPGYRSSMPLPVSLSSFPSARTQVSLSSFRPVRERATGKVVITWVTEAELNNAGFNIKRSKTKEGPFKVINQKGPIAGHGTTGERHVYTYTDTTARPTIVYYYQLECVSADGTRRTLTTTHLRGHVDGSLHHFQEVPFWWKDLNR